ncbi:MAG: protein translocase subunit SecF [Bacillota bacterium]|nr:protein translocase subunit SecF [Bacillota bacterium]
MKIDVIKNKKISFGISALIIIIGIIMMIVSGLNFGIDFTGGTLIQIDLGKEVPVDEIREVMDTYDNNASVVHAGEGNHEVIIKTTKDYNNDQRIEIFNQYKEKYNLEDNDLINQQKFGAAIGEETRKRALLSVAIATVGMLIYITYRFEFNFGLAAITALIHDVLIGLSVYSILRIPVNSSFIAAMLIIVGYSINDTIVVFDRIRENIKKTRKQPFDEIINKSIKQTIRRSIYTSATTLIAVTLLYILGVEAIKDFALPLIIGVLAGTYSSLFIASPVWYLLKTRKSKVNLYNPNSIDN